MIVFRRCWFWYPRRNVWVIRWGWSALVIAGVPVPDVARRMLLGG